MRREVALALSLAALVACSPPPRWSPPVSMYVNGSMIYTEPGDENTARIEDGRPKIIYDASDWQELPNHLRLFVWYHEAGHYIAGHVTPGRKRTADDEQAADCYAVWQVKPTPWEMAEIMAWLREQRGDEYHLNGPQRAGMLLECWSMIGGSSD